MKVEWITTTLCFSWWKDWKKIWGSNCAMAIHDSSPTCHWRNYGRKSKQCSPVTERFFSLKKPAELSFISQNRITLTMAKWASRIFNVYRAHVLLKKLSTDSVRNIHEIQYSEEENLSFNWESYEKSKISDTAKEMIDL